MIVTANPDLLELTERLRESEREVDAARETCRKLLHALTDTRITIEAASQALRDFDTVTKGGK